MALRQLRRWKNPPPQKGFTYVPTTIEKISNSITHLLWIPISIYFASRLFEKSKTSNELLVACIYGIALISLFGISSAYHCCTLCKTKRWYHDTLHCLDRLVIFFFIAASYTPWLLLREFYMDVGKVSLTVIWTIALCGAVYQYHYRGKWQLLELFLYLMIGVLPAASVTYIKDFSGMYEVALGGLVYIVGAFFFRMDGRIPLAHAIWHCLVTFAVFLHYDAIERHLFTQKL